METNGIDKVTLLIDPEVLEEEAETIRSLNQKLQDLHDEEIICKIVVPSGETLEITNLDYQHYKKGTIRKFMKEYKDDAKKTTTKDT